MSSSQGERPDWELADGPVVGRDVPITSEPREEEAPGVPVAPVVDSDSEVQDGPDQALTEEHESPVGDAGSGSAGADDE